MSKLSKTHSTFENEKRGPELMECVKSNDFTSFEEVVDDILLRRIVRMLMKEMKH